MTSLLEDRGIKVLLIGLPERVSGLTSQVRRQRQKKKVPVIVALLHDSTAARVGALFQLLVQDTTAQDFGLPSSAIRLRM